MTTAEGRPDPALVEALVAALRAGDPVVVPTDTVYGLAALPSVPGATAGLFALKDRRPDTPLAVLVADVAAARDAAAAWTPSLDRLADRFWPGPLTLVVARGPAAGDWELGGDPGTIGLRCPAHALVRAVAAEAGPIATTSANAHGRPTPSTATAAAATLTGPVAVVADGGPLEGSASTVVDLTGPEPVLLREGPLPLAAVLGALAAP